MQEATHTTTESSDDAAIWMSDVAAIDPTLVDDCRLAAVWMVELVRRHEDLERELRRRRAADDWIIGDDLEPSGAADSFDLLHLVQSVICEKVTGSSSLRAGELVGPLAELELAVALAGRKADPRERLDQLEAEVVDTEARLVAAEARAAALEEALVDVGAASMRAIADHGRHDTDGPDLVEPARVGFRQRLAALIAGG